MKTRVLHVRSGFTVGGPEQVVLAGLDVLRNEFDFTVASFVLPNIENAFLLAVSHRGIAAAPVNIQSSFDRSALPQLANLVGKADIIVAHDYRALGLSVSVLKRLPASTARPPLIAVSHGWTSHTWRVRIYEWLERHWYKNASRIIAVSKAKYQELQSRGIDSARLRLIENGVAIPEIMTSAERRTLRREFGISDNDIMILTVGRLSPEKAQNNLVAALAELILTDSKIRVFVLGDGPLRAELDNDILERQLDAQVKLVGWRKDTPRWYAAADLFVLPSLTEGLPMALLEAQAHALPAIASNVGGCGDVIENGVTGMLVTPGDIPALQQAIQHVISDSAWRTQAGQLARQRIINHYGSERYAAQWRELYLELRS